MHEKRGGNLPLAASCDDFRAWSDSFRLTHLLTRGAKFTWTIGRRSHAGTEMHLDRAICNDAWIDHWNTTTCCTLPRSKSDHHPLLFSVSREVNSYPSSFKFLNMWASHPDCSRPISETWKKPVVGCPMFVLTQKLKTLKAELKTWNKTVFGNVHNKVDSAMLTIEQIQNCINRDGWFEHLTNEEKQA